MDKITQHLGIQERASLRLVNQSFNMTVPRLIHNELLEFERQLADEKSLMKADLLCEYLQGAERYIYLRFAYRYPRMLRDTWLACRICLRLWTVERYRDSRLQEALLELGSEAAADRTYLHC